MSAESDEESKAQQATEAVAETIEDVSSDAPPPGVSGAAPAPVEEAINAAPFLVPGMEGELKAPVQKFQQILFEMPMGAEKKLAKVAIYILINAAYNAEAVSKIFTENPMTFPENTQYSLGEKFDDRPGLETYLREHAVKNKDGRFHWWPPMVLQ